MKKILINIKEDSLVFAYRNSINKEQGNLLNTNIISDNELVFSEEYIKNNQKIVALFIKELCIEKNIHSVIVSKMELVIPITKLLKKNDYITKLIIKENENLTYEICEELLHNNYIKLLNCFSAPTFMLEILDKHDIKIETRNETFFTSNFMLENNLQQFSKIYYKTSVRFSPPLDSDDLEDFNSFCKINRYLKNIHFNEFDIYSIDDILKIVNDNRMKNIKFLIHDDSNILENIEYLKKLNKMYSKKRKISFKISYSDKYINDNIFKQVILNTLKICGLIITLIVIGIISYVTISNYKAMQDMVAIKKDINNVIEKSKEEKEELIQENIDNSNNISEDSEEVIVNTDIAALLSINSDVYGWLKVNNTNVDYPVVKTNDNKYYLKHNLYKEKDKNGWIFMDYRNSTTSEVNKHTIIYGHNMYYSGVMFGTLIKSYQKSWYSNKENQIITFDTLYKDMKYQIFSIYKIPKTSDYLKTEFNDDTDFINFVTLLKDRSVNNFNVEINANDKILTLSTCTGDNSRLVVHAKLITEE